MRTWQTWIFPNNKRRLRTKKPEAAFALCSIAPLGAARFLKSVKNGKNHWPFSPEYAILKNSFPFGGGLRDGGVFSLKEKMRNFEEK